MSQTVTSDRFPYLPLYLEVRQRNERVEALVDTGFDGDVVVPSDFIADTERPDSYLSCRLADTSEVLAPVYRSHVRMDGFGSFPVLVLVLGDEPIVGRGVTDRFTIILDHGQQVRVEP